MVIILTAFAAAAQSLPIDRTALDLQARAEALQPRSRAAAARTAPRRPAAQPTRTASTRQPTVRPGPSRQIQPGPSRASQSATAGSAAQRRTQPRRASSGGPLDLASITTICRAAGNQSDPAAFIARLASAYSLSDADSTSLRASCAAYLAGRADARRASGGTY